MKYPVLLLLACAATTANAQDEHIGTDRPSETQSAQTVEARTLQVEFGIRRELEEGDLVQYYHPRTVLRFGVTKWLELRTEITQATLRDKKTGNNTTGLQPLEPGIKAHILAGKAAVPTVAFLAQVGIPKLSSQAFRTTYAEPRFRLLFENELSKTVRLTYNVGAEWNGEETKPQWIYTFAPEFRLGKNWELFTEVFGKIGQHALPEHSFDAGIAYFVGRNAKFDLSAGVGLNNAAPVNFVALGFSLRTGK